ncbi:MAG TPA: hypothetical protein VK819_16495 [Acidobacteriaceae bacterium]|jgi:hypothetical protein|nr:hypothetical protein [Acidobacteriaceae bacterium]
MRTVVEEQSVSEAVDKARNRYPRLGDVFEGMKWYLARAPERGEALDDVNWVYRQDGDADEDVPDILTIYTFDADRVILKYIDFKDAIL